MQQGTVDALDATDAAQFGRHRLGDDRAPVHAVYAHGNVAVLVQRANQLLVHLAGKDGAYDFHALIRGDALAVLELDGNAGIFHGARDVLAAAMHDDRVHAYRLQQNDVGHDVGTQLGVDHSRATVLDDDRLSRDVLDPGQRFGQQLRRLFIGNAVRARVFREFHVR